MSVDPSEQGLARLALRWPSHRRRLAALSETNDCFVSLCAAYNDACDALDIWRRSAAPGAASRVIEYRELVDDLEQDILRLVIGPTR